MSGVGRARAWLRAVMLRSRMEREMRDEMSAHIAQAAERFEARGMSRREAFAAAHREFGNVGALEDDAREARGGQWIDDTRRDLKYAFRYFARTPLTTITIVVTLALGIGFSSAAFSVMNGILARPAPGVPDDPALVKIRGLNDVQPFARRLSYPELTAYAGLTDKFTSVVGYATSSAIVDIGDAQTEVMTVRAVFTTPNYFPTLGVGLVTGRGFDQTRFDEIAPPELTAIVSHGFAVERFGDERGAVGRELRVNDVPVTIIGVAPPGFFGAVQAGSERTFWLPLSAWQMVGRVEGRRFTDPNAESFEAFARLRAGVSVGGAATAVGVVAARADAAAKAERPRELTRTADVVRLRGLIPSGRYEGEIGPGILIFTLISLLILLVCTTTVNSLLVGSAVARRYEIGVRLALGASRARVIRQLLTEISILAIAGGALGMWAFGAVTKVIEVAKDGFDVSPTWGTMGFTMLYALMTATLCGLSPALSATRAGLSEVLKDSTTGTSRRSRLQRIFVIAQIAIAQPLMVGLATMMAYALEEVPESTIGTVRDRLVIAELSTSVAPALGAADRIPDVVHRLSELPGVQSAMPMGYGFGRISLELPAALAGGDSAAPRVNGVGFDVPPGYFRAVEATMVRGREFTPADTLGSSRVVPVILAESLATALFRTRDPIGQRLLRVSAYDRQPTEVEVVGVVRMDRQTNTLEYPPDDPPVFIPYRPANEVTCRQLGTCIAATRLLIRTTERAEPLIPAMRRAVREEARLLPVSRVWTLSYADEQRRKSRLEVMGVGAGAGAIALALAAIGLYAMMSVAVDQRRKEIGVRVALGGRARQVVAMFFRSGLRVAVSGMVLGLPLTVAGVVFITGQLALNRNVVATSAAAVVFAVLCVAALASWLPARRAAYVDPMTALRTE